MPKPSQPRRHDRVAVELSVRVSTIDPETDPRTGRPFFRASRELCSNLSRGGVYIRTTDVLHPGRRVLVELELPGGSQLEAVGRVAWSKTVLSPEGQAEDNGVGVEFLGGCPAQFSALESFLEHHGRGSPAPGN